MSEVKQVAENDLKNYKEQLKDCVELKKPEECAITQRTLKVARRKSLMEKSDFTSNLFNEFGGFKMGSSSAKSAVGSSSFTILGESDESSGASKKSDEIVSKFLNVESSHTNIKSKTDSFNVALNSTPAMIQYLSNIKELNIAVSDWIKSHVDDNPLCILTPVFKGYHDYLKVFKERLEKIQIEEKTVKKSLAPQEELTRRIKSLNFMTVDRIKKQVDVNPLCNLSPVFEEYLKKMKEYQNVRDAPLDGEEHEPMSGNPHRMESH